MSGSGVPNTAIVFQIEDISSLYYSLKPLEQAPYVSPQLPKST